MLFNSYSFFVFFPIVVVVYFLLPKRVSYLWLLTASYYFYMGWNAKYALLLEAPQKNSLQLVPENIFQSTYKYFVQI
jgi:D-alanyl-lipoteichoic acid acyltransferase DltB (MBOAT superfamily)